MIYKPTRVIDTMMKTIQKIVKTVYTAPYRPKVCAYTRISIDPHHNSNSLNSQISYYNNLIKGNPRWQFAGIYSDDGITGTKTDIRTAFNQMISDAEKGLIDIILTKSLSRFARNTVDLLTIIRHLKEINVAVEFEREKINTLTENGELLITLLSSFAQEEALSISSNYQWAVDKKYEKGIVLHNNVYGYRWNGKQLLFEPEEAIVVRRIFTEYLSGKPTAHIIRDLNADGCITRTGHKFSKSTLHWILHNERYTGNTILRKTYRENPLTKHQVMNYGEKTKYFVSNTNPAIVSQDEFDRVQLMMKCNEELGCYSPNANEMKDFSRKVKCIHCGSWYCRGSKAHKDYRYWKCGRALKQNQALCPESHLIMEDDIRSICCTVLKTETFDKQMFDSLIDFIESDGISLLVFHFRNGNVQEVSLQCKEQ